LTGKMNEQTKFGESDFRKNMPRFAPDAMKANQAFVDLLAKVAERRGVTVVQIALGWLLAQRPWIVPIPGTTRLARLEENVGAAEVRLTSDDLREIDASASKLTVRGARYPEEMQRMIDR